MYNLYTNLMRFAFFSMISQDRRRAKRKSNVKLMAHLFSGMLAGVPLFIFGRSPISALRSVMPDFWMVALGLYFVIVCVVVYLLHRRAWREGLFEECEKIVDAAAPDYKVELDKDMLNKANGLVMVPIFVGIFLMFILRTV